MLNAVLVVLGDVGHSPRMCYHASSLASHGVHVELVGYSGSTPHSEIADNPMIKIVHIPSPPPQLSHPSVPRPLQLVLKFGWSFWILLFALLFRTAWWPSLLLMQNPPGIPSMFVCWLCAKLKSASFIVDWHNYTFTILEQTFPVRQNHGHHARGLRRVVLFLQECFIQFTSAWEGFFGKCADSNICVSHTMRRDLKQRWGVNAVTLYDKPPKWNFTNLDLPAKHEFLTRLFDTPDFRKFRPEETEAQEYDEINLFTTRKGDKFAYRPERPLFLVSSTSWTEDEDFGILLDALRDYDKNVELRNACTEKTILPELFVVITGKGPQKEAYLQKISRLHLKSVHIVTAWLAAADYPKVLASADLGVSLHTSSSGLDLPMKIVDMFGCQLPVLAKRFPAIDEQVHEGTNGRLFDTSANLRQALMELASEFPTSKALSELRQGLRAEQRISWHEQWDASIWPLVEPLFWPRLRELRRRERFRYRPEDFDENEEEDGPHHHSNHTIHTNNINHRHDNIQDDHEQEDEHDDDILSTLDSSSED